MLYLLQFGHAQRNDARLWASIRLEKQVSPRLLAHFKEAIRIGQNITQLNYSFSDIGLTFKVNKHIFVSLDYRLIHKLQMEEYISVRHRFYFTLLLKKKFKPFIISTRFIFQSELQDIYSSEEGKIPDYYLRSKITVKYDLNRFRPYLATELHTNVIRWEQLLPNRYRAIGGLSYELNKMNELEAFYIFERRFNEYNPLTNYIIGIGYTHRFY